MRAALSEHEPPQPTKAWCCDRLRDYCPVAPHLPVLEESITQIEAGEFKGGASIVNGDGVTLYLARIFPRSVGVTIIRPTHIAFAIPISWKGEYRINGMVADPTAMYLPGGGQHCHIVGMDRATFGVLLRRDRFIETVAALRGIGPEDVALDGEPHVLPPSAADRLRRRLAGILRDQIESLTHNGLERRTSEFADEVFGLITEAYQLARPATPPGRGSLSKPGRIVCKAEECFAAAEGGKVSLADLCAATHVSQSALYAAFQTVCDLPPLAYFRRRRLTRARSLLLQSSPRLGAVKHAALESGFTELGRFSVEYRRLFGESPSVTLTRQAF